MTDEEMMQIALEEARRAVQLEEAPIGAALYCHERLLAKAHNIRESENDPTGHAEILALREGARVLGDWRLNECTLAVTLEPCVMCAGAIVNARVGRLIYGASDPKAGAVVSLYEICSDQRLNHKPRITGGILKQETGQILTEFFRQRRA